MKLFNKTLLSATTALFCGLLFGLGLTVSGMTDTAKVIGFLDIFGQWDASLMFVMGAGLAITIPAFYFIAKKSSPVFEAQFCLPTNTSIDSKLIVGAAVFGCGWGLYGFCPGPAIASITTLKPDTLIFMATMLIGMALAERFSRKQAS